MKVLKIKTIDLKGDSFSIDIFEDYQKAQIQINRDRYFLNFIDIEIHDKKEDLKFFDPQIKVKKKAIAERLQFFPNTKNTITFRG